MAREARCASTSAPRRASARPTPCSTRAGAATSAAPTWSSATSRPTTGPNTLGPDPRPRGRAPHAARVPRTPVRGDGRRRRPRPQPGSRWSTSWPTPTCPGSRTREALAGRRGAARRRHRRHLDGQHPAPRVAQRRGRADHRRRPARDGARRGRARRRPDRAGRHEPRGAAPPDGPRQHLPARAGRRRARPTTSGPATSPRCASWRCCGWPTGSRRASTTTWTPTASTRRGRRASGWSWPSPARRAASSSSGGRRASPAGARRAARRARRRRRRPGRPPPGPTSSSIATCSASWAGRTTRSWATRWPGRSSRFARAEQATQLVLGATHRSRLDRAASGLGRSTRVFCARRAHRRACDRPTGEATTLAPRHSPTAACRRAVAPRRGARRWILAAVGLPLLARARRDLATSLGLPTVLLLYSRRRRRWRLGGHRGRRGRRAIVGVPVSTNWFFTPPLHTFSIAEAENVARSGRLRRRRVIVERPRRRGRTPVEAKHCAPAEAEALAARPAALVGATTRSRDARAARAPRSPRLRRGSRPSSEHGRAAAGRRGRHRRPTAVDGAARHARADDAGAHGARHDTRRTASCCGRSPTSWRSPSNGATLRSEAADAR